MDIFEQLKNTDPYAQEGKDMADAAVAEIRERIKDQILFLKENSQDPNIKNHLKMVSKENWDILLGSLSNQDIIDFNEVILKRNWKQYLERNKEGMLTKYYQEKFENKSDELLAKDAMMSNPADEFRFSFKAMIKHYARNCEIDEETKKREKERDELKKTFQEKLEDIRGDRPHVVAVIEGLDMDMLRKADYEVIINLDKQHFQGYEEKLKNYFSMKIGSTREARPEDIKAEIIRDDPRFKYYCALRAALGMEGPCNPEIFLSNQGL